MGIINNFLYKRKIFYGWWIVLASIVSSFYGIGIFNHGFTAFFNPIVKEFGWSRAVTSGAFALQRAESGLSAPIVGWLIDKYGPRKTMLLGSFLSGLGLIFLSRIDTLLTFYFAFLVISFGISLSTFLVSFITVTVWFQDMRGRALALLSAGSAGLGGTLVPGLVWLISSYDWRTALVVIGIGFWVIVTPMALIMRSRPEDYGYLPDGKISDKKITMIDVNESSRFNFSKPKQKSVVIEQVEYTYRTAIKSTLFWRLSLTFSFGWMLISAISVHQIPALMSFGIGDQLSGLVVMAVMLVSVIGRLVAGFLGDYLDKRYILATAYILQLVGCIIFSNLSATWLISLYVLFFGLGHGSTIPVAFAILADYFGRENFGTIVTLNVTIGTVFSMVSPVFAGWMFDITSSYRPAFLIICLTLIPSIILILTTRPYQTSMRN